MRGYFLPNEEDKTAKTFLEISNKKVSYDAEYSSHMFKGVNALWLVAKRIGINSL